MEQAALSRMLSPWAVLGAVLARAIAATPPNVVLPAIVGAVGSLNTYVALVGPSGSGKDAALDTAADCVDLGRRIRTRAVGSGQGIMGQYVRTRQIAASDEGPARSETYQIEDRLLLHIREIHELKASAGQLGATILPTLTAAWTASLLGGAYKNEKLDLEVDPHTYRLGVVAGVQPGEAEILTRNEALGLPQRFIWVPATSVRAALDSEPDWPGTLEVRLPDNEAEPTELDELARGEFLQGPRVEMSVCETAREVIKADRKARVHPEFDGDPLESHALFCRLKVAAGFALMDGRMDVGEADWELAGSVAVMSRRTRRSVLSSLEGEARKAKTAKKIEAIEIATATQRATAEQAHQAEILKAKTRILKVLMANRRGLAHNQLYREIGPRYRKAYHEARDILTEDETILEIDGIFKITDAQES